MKAIEVSNLTHCYGTKTVLRQLSFAIEQGGIVGLLGKNGVGKSTLNNILHGFLNPTLGEASIFGSNCSALPPHVKARVAILLEGHIQYPFFNVKQVERFYSKVYPRWNSTIFWELIDLLQVENGQTIATMSYGQKSQVALAQMLAQNADLMILDDFSMGLDSGYRRLFVDYLRQYVKGTNKTVFATSHIIQDMERLIDNVMIMTDKGIIVQNSLGNFLDTLHCFEFELSNDSVNFPSSETPFESYFRIRNRVECYSYSSKLEIESWLKRMGIEYSEIKSVKLSLEDAFIGLTGKY